MTTSPEGARPADGPPGGALLPSARTTREPAAALFVSRKTIEYHLRNVYLKLGISSRQELAEAMRR